MSTSLKTDSRDTRRPYLVYGLTGGIASGKSTAARFFAEAGIPVIDADQIARELSAPGGAARAAIEKRFGTADRAVLRGIVFQDPDARRDLEAILHPLIRAESLRRMKEANAPIVIYEAALLIESGRASDFDGIILVEAPENARIARIQARDGLSEADAKRIIAAQMSDETRRQSANYRVQNDQGLLQLKKCVSDLIESLKSNKFRILGSE